MNFFLENMLWLVTVGLVVCLAAWLVIRWLRGREKPTDQQDLNLAVDVSQLSQAGPPKDGPRLEFYGTPVRLSVIVLAPSGREGALPPPNLLPGVLERLVPGLAAMIASHQPVIRRWPEQLSSQGFAQSFFNHVRLPGNRGKGTPWCSIAGKHQVGERQFLVGMAFRAANANGLGQLYVQHEGIWLDVLRIRE